MTEPILLDARGLLCPLPVLKARRALKPLAAGSQLVLLADDPAARIDVAHFCTEDGHALLADEDAGDHRAFRIRKGG